MSSRSTSSLESAEESFHESQPNVFNETIPLELTSVTDEAVHRSISRIQSRRSSNSRLPGQDEDQRIEQHVSPYRDIEKALGDEKSNGSDIDATSKDTKTERFSNRTKKICIFIAAVSGFLSPLSSLAFLPAIPEMAKEYNTTGEIINVSSAVYCVFMSLSPCVFSPFSDIYGRRFSFLVCSCLFSVCSILVAVSPHLAMFFVFRSLTALVGTAFFSIGAHIVGDLYIPTERGTYMSIIIMGAQFGTALGSVGGGIIVNFTSWRVIFFVLAGIGFVVMAMAFVFLPETSLETKHQIVLREARKDNPNKKFVFITYNPLRIMTALKYPNLSIDGFITISVVFTMYSLLTPIRYVMDPRFDLTSPILSALFYLPPGLGYLVGSLFGGRWADYTVKKYIKIKGRRVPEDRLRTILIPIGVVYPACMIIYGWSVEKEKGGIAVPVIFMFISGVAQTCIFPAANTYCVDSMPELGGDGIGSSYFSRYIAAAVASATCLRSIDNIGVGWSCTISAFVLWVGAICGIVLIYFGESMRKKALIKYGLRTPESFNTN
ncbi:DEHA2A10362p [Debaryomyces hansenii CBS767]|uniref:DEHA2A10362p n=1 Tax=Debaryomyces hansenii (strain ATCC 36239 / CBS 767 / BCRC 21394 / JCM 1990 / NBRC 0083 / IGC 2968) TaxID=284592 RepID=Q6BYD7_DEBHA|nr:DEHA2A10362p [Debaryomyces hansenii CBS767]CAG84748.2 DEHA2A10362p [Debaryomyces hansenii CBS767]|eukprot:XP_456782.2 DEHA2A10362p [Debaryomyces hansenii CBS767]